MSLTQEQKDQFNNLLLHREEVVRQIAEIEKIIKNYFPEEFPVAYQHWIPQIITALYDDTKWLPRGQQSMENTIKRIRDKISKDSGQGVKKYI